MGPGEVKGHVMHIIAQFIQCKLLFAIRCDAMTESCCLFPFSPQFTMYFIIFATYLPRITYVPKMYVSSIS